ncbi:polyketide synthase, partial [Streptomyces coelicoflavus ZG0656]
EAVASWLLDRLAAELRFDRAKLAGDVPVHDYGMDSIMVSQLVQTVAQRLDVSVDPSALLEHPTVDGFASYLGEEHRTELLAQFGDTETGDTETGDRETGGTAPEARTGAEVPPVTAAPAPVWAFDAPSTAPSTAPATAPATAPVTTPRDALNSPAPAPASAPRAGDVAVVGLSCRFP